MNLMPPNSIVPVNGLARRDRDSLLEILTRHYRTVLGMAAVGLLGGVVYAGLAPKGYTARSRLYIQPGGPGLLNGKTEQALGDPRTFLSTQCALIASTPVLAKALETPGVRDLPTLADKPSAYDYLKERLNVDMGKTDELVSVSFESASPKDAEKIAAAVVDAYQAYEKSRRNSSASTVSATLGEARGRAEAELAAKLKAQAAFRTAHGIIAASDEKYADLSRQRLESIAASLAATHVEVVDAKMRRDEFMKTSGADAMADAAQSSRGNVSVGAQDLAILRQRLLDADSRLRELSRVCLPENPAVKAAQARADELNFSYGVALHQSYNATAAREADLQGAYASEEKALIAHGAFLSQHQQMEAEIGRVKKLIESLDTRLRELDLSNDGAMATILVIEPARVDPKPTSPHKLRAIALAMMAGLSLGGMAALVRDRIDARLLSEEDVLVKLGLPVLATLPSLHGHDAKVETAQRLLNAASSPWANAYRLVRAAILLSARTRDARTIAVVSPSKGDGRTTLAANLAISLAQAGKRVLLIDADLHSPSLHTLFNAELRPGLTQAIELGQGDRLTGEIPHQRTPVAGLHLLASGGSSQFAADLLNREAFNDLLTRCADAYDYVVVDTPSADTGTDVSIVAAACDLTLLALCPGKHDRYTAERLNYALAMVGANLAGVVLNDIRAESGRAAILNPPLKSLHDETQQTNGHASLAMTNGRDA